MTRRNLIEKLIAVYEAKNNDYGNSAHRTYVEFGEVALVIRISDKLSRLKTLLSGEQMVKDESVLDTIGDAVTYLCMLCAEIDCDMPELPDAERLEMDENVESTVLYLQTLEEKNLEMVVAREDVGQYRELLVTIWKAIADPEIRIEEYMNLAEQLVEEYLWRVT